MGAVWLHFLVILSPPIALWKILRKKAANQSLRDDRSFADLANTAAREHQTELLTTCRMRKLGVKQRAQFLLDNSYSITLAHCFGHKPKLFVLRSATLIGNAKSKSIGCRGRTARPGQFCR